MTLTEKDKQKINESIHAWGNNALLDLSFGKYWVKPVSQQDMVNELLAKKIMDEMEVYCPVCYFSKIDGHYYFLSKDLNSLGDFVTYEQMNGKNNSLYTIWDVLEKRYGKEIINGYSADTSLMVDVLKFYCFVQRTVITKTGEY